MPSVKDAATAPSPLAYYLAQLRLGHLAYQYSPQAGRAVFFPRLVCPFTGSERLEWRESSGLGTVHATTVVYPREGAPYNVALIDVDEGFRMMSRVEGPDPAEVRIGLRVSLHIISGGEAEDPLPVFRPLADAVHA
ncbi:MAG: OB-fold domain-containing protein [Pseudomonadota bacterium]